MTASHKAQQCTLCRSRDIRGTVKAVTCKPWKIEIDQTKYELALLSRAANFPPRARLQGLRTKARSATAARQASQPAIHDGIVGQPTESPSYMKMNITRMHAFSLLVRRRSKRGNRFTSCNNENIPTSENNVRPSSTMKSTTFTTVIHYVGGSWD